MNPLHSLLEEEAINLVKQVKKRFEDGVTPPHVLATDPLSKHRNDQQDWITCVYRKLLACKRSLVESLYAFLGFSMDGFDDKLDLIWRLTETTLLAQRDLIEVFFTSRELPLSVKPDHRFVSQMSYSVGGR
jgi:hypothetical protein